MWLLPPHCSEDRTHQQFCCKGNSDYRGATDLVALDRLTVGGSPGLEPAPEASLDRRTGTGDVTEPAAGVALLAWSDASAYEAVGGGDLDARAVGLRRSRA